MKLPLPQDPTQRALAIAVACSIVLHVLLLGSMVWVNRFAAATPAKRGETLFVDIAPDKPEEKAPLGTPARPPAPPESPRKAPAPRMPRPTIAEAPAPKPAPVRPAPEPPREVARSTPPPPEPPAAPPPTPEPAPAPSPPREVAPREPSPTPQPAETPKTQASSSGSAPSPSGERAETQTALAKPQPSSPAAGIFRSPGGGGGLLGGRGGAAGEPVPLDTPDPDYREYMQRVKRRIYAKWGYPYDAQSRGLQGQLIIEFHIAKDGHLQFIELKKSSGEDILDSFAMTAVKLAQIYDPLPDAMKRDVLPVVAVFIYTLRGPLSVLQSLQ
ncbi:MAG TPA: TonB family protein [Methylomirabilota bacterium]|nr:TonB family protein [Methylomirabilota bacterium]